MKKFQDLKKKKYENKKVMIICNYFNSKLKSRWNGKIKKSNNFQSHTYPRIKINFTRK